MRIVFKLCANRSGRASDERHHRALNLVGSLGLAVNARLITMIMKRIGRDLPARIAVDACGIDKEISGHVLWQPFVAVRHTFIK